MSHSCGYFVRYDVRCVLVMGMVVMFSRSLLVSGDKNHDGFATPLKTIDQQMQHANEIDKINGNREVAWQRGDSDVINSFGDIEGSQHKPVRRSADDVIAKRPDLHKVFLGRKRYFDDGPTLIDTNEYDEGLNNVLVGLEGRYQKRPRPFLGKRSAVSQVAASSWLPMDEDETEINKRPHSKPFLGKRSEQE